MAGPTQKKKKGRSDSNLQRKLKTKNRSKDLDEINDNLTVEKAEKLLNQEVDVDKPGDAQFYCLHCARYFIDSNAMEAHFKTKVHKRRLKALELEPYSHEDAERAAGHGSYQPPKKRKLETQKPLTQESIIKEEEYAMN